MSRTAITRIMLIRSGFKTGDLNFFFKSEPTSYAARLKAAPKNNEFVTKIKNYCKTPRSKESLAKFFGYDENHPAYFINSYILPLIEQGILAYTIPNKPRSKNQRIYAVE